MTTLLLAVVYLLLGVASIVGGFWLAWKRNHPFVLAFTVLGTALYLFGLVGVLGTVEEGALPLNLFPAANLAGVGMNLVALLFAVVVGHKPAREDDCERESETAH